MTDIEPSLAQPARVANFQSLETPTRDTSNHWNPATVAANDPWAEEKRPLFPLRERAIAPVLFFLALTLVPAFHALDGIQTETVNMLGRYVCFAIVAVGLDLVWGYTGILSLCQSLFFALGGYAMGMHLAQQGDKTNGIPECLYFVYPYAIGEARGSETLPWFWKMFDAFPVAVVLAIALPAAFAATIGFFGFKSRVRGVYFSILTQALTVAAAMFFGKNEMKFCGTNGLTHFKTIAGFDLTNPDVKVGLYLVSVLGLALAYGLCRWVTKSRLGRVLVAVRDAESMLRFSGYQPHLYKVLVFALSAGLAGLAGLLYTPQAMIINPSMMEAKWSILIVIWVAVGGRGTLGGAIFGALAVNLLYNFLTSERQILFLHWKPAFWPFLLGVLFVLVVLKLPRGVVPSVIDLFKRPAPRRAMP